ncbi:hypothetical protein FQE82_19265 [Escherichia coli]|nr:hypothetical protein [Escherichia coli]EFB4639903.1 hypothetical protein [Escherichia coli]EFD0341396.1 hypothetical protein [Escherichia coli]OZO59684.1 hypothetical protein CG693_07340 [Escherichia coli]OZO89592.1 hypothetical protein CG698_06520 [Escherichia coli]
MSRGLFPRHLRATFASFFVHLPIRGQTAPPQGGKGINSIKKIVQICALLCRHFLKKIPPKRDFSSQRFLSSFHPIRKH